MEVNQNEAWLYNFLCRIFDQEELQILKWNEPKELEAFLIYSVRDAYSEWEADIIMLHFMEQMPPEAIAKKMRRQKERIEEVIANAGDKLKDPLRYRYLKYGMAEIKKRDMEPPKGIPIMQQTIDELDLSVKTFNCLKRANVQSVEDLTHVSRLDLMKIRNMGKQSIGEVERKLADKGLALRQDDE